MSSCRTCRPWSKRSRRYPRAGRPIPRRRAHLGVVVPVTVTVGVVTVAPGAGEVTVSGSVPRQPVRDVPVGDDVGRLEVAARAEVERQPGVRGLRPGQRAGRARGLAVLESDRRRRRVRAERRGERHSRPPTPARARGPGPRSSFASRSEVARASAAVAARRCRTRRARWTAPATGGRSRCRSAARVRPVTVQLVRLGWKQSP